MQTLSVVGPGAGGIVAELSSRLEGRVAVVERSESVDEEPAAGDTRITLDDDGRFVAVGSDRSFDDLLDSLAPDYDYALVAGFSRLRLPTVVVGSAAESTADRRPSADDGGEVAGDVVLRAEEPADVDVDWLAEEIDGFEPHVTLEALVERATSSPKAEFSGAVATFTGRVRAKEHEDDDPTTHLKFEKYEDVAAERMEKISQELTTREGVLEVLMHHRTGVVADGEDIVFVVVLAGHREEAFQAVEDGINRLKDEVPIFKKETTVEEEFWVHDRA